MAGQPRAREHQAVFRAQSEAVVVGVNEERVVPLVVQLAHCGPEMSLQHALVEQPPKHVLQRFVLVRVEECKLRCKRPERTLDSDLARNELSGGRTASMEYREQLNGCIC
jgi:hypothetical protein